MDDTRASPWWSPERRADVVASVRRIATHIGAAHDLEVVFEHEEGYPVTVNDPRVAAAVLDASRELLGERASTLAPAPLMGAEDFSYVLEQVPGAMAFLGASPGPGPQAPNHSNRMVIDESAMSTGIALHTAIALRHLAG